MKFCLPFLLAMSLFSCMKGKSVDLVVHNARIHTMDDENSIEEAMAIKDGKIVEVGPERQILNKYSADEYIDAGKKDVFPGLTSTTVLLTRSVGGLRNNSDRSMTLWSSMA